ncbi:hypothetical protein B5E64_05910 [Drancourtella sp. An12]|uniref:bacterial Ig-like domain-containing protein n=1 Tax=Drancourtella sp. An12 TaxID=1965548 RepID=UPI000B3A2314|nr:bacterial Ig-like domain-containing protein [Drancourtella sp. An12]OUQ46293.1 hypothetical protein B5E64_05910 [Drancourtella sp. An12]
MRRILKELRPFKKPLILIGIILLFLVIFTQVIPAIREMDANKTPVASIEAKNGKTYEKGDTIRVQDFQLTAVHESGKRSSLSGDDVKLSRTKPAKTGKYTEVTLTYKDNKEIQTTVKVKNSRNKLAAYACGSPSKGDVKAVLYSNGELCFEGEGNVLQFEQGEFPWLNSEEDIPIQSVTFEEGVQPVSLDYWFEGLADLSYIAPLPASVQSIVGMCAGCEALETAPDWSGCTGLLDATEAYSGCTALKEIPALPASLRNTTRMCEDCAALQTAPDMTGAAGLENATEMFAACQELTATSTPPVLEVMDGMYQDCINLKAMPAISGTVRSMSGTFSGDISLSELSAIPASVQDISSCFEGCSRASGELKVDCTPEDYSGFLTGACNATRLNLTGGSRYLEVLANTCDSGNVLVNGKTPNPEATSPAYYEE